MAWPLVIAGAVALASGIYKGIQAKKQRNKLNNEVDKLGTYQENPLARQMLGYAQSIYNGRMAGATNAEQNIMANRANTIAAVERGATDSGQVISAASESQRMSDMAVNELGQLESQDKINRYGLLQNAAMGVINERDKEWQDKVRATNQRMAIYGVYSKNMTDAVDGAASGITSLGTGALGAMGSGSGSVGSVYGGNNSVWSNAIKNPYN